MFLLIALVFLGEFPGLGHDQNVPHVYGLLLVAETVLELNHVEDVAVFDNGHVIGLAFGVKEPVGELVAGIGASLVAVLGAGERRRLLHARAQRRQGSAVAHASRQGVGGDFRGITGRFGLAVRRRDVVAVLVLLDFQRTVDGHRFVGHEIERLLVVVVGRLDFLGRVRQGILIGRRVGVVFHHAEQFGLVDALGDHTAERRLKVAPDACPGGAGRLG